ncbi:unnamed protein product, partial [Ectocarpus fasciculatus]
PSSAPAALALALSVAPSRSATPSVVSAGSSVMRACMLSWTSSMSWLICCVSVPTSFLRADTSSVDLSLPSAAESRGESSPSLRPAIPNGLPRGMNTSVLVLVLYLEGEDVLSLVLDTQGE